MHKQLAIKPSQCCLCHQDQIMTQARQHPCTSAFRKVACEATRLRLQHLRWPTTGTAQSHSGCTFCCMRPCCAPGPKTTDCLNLWTAPSGLTILCFDVWEAVALLHCSYLHIGVLLGKCWQQLVKVIPASSV
jgi:hypothetical protein